MSRTALVMLGNAAGPLESDRAEAAPPFRSADPVQPQVNVRDFAVTRGDGVFESIRVIDGRAHGVDSHLERFRRSAALLDLPEPDTAMWRGAISEVLARLDPVAEAYVRIVLSRGIEGEDGTTGWAYAAPSPDYSAARAEGVRIVLLDRGYRHDITHTAPWLLVGAKSLSYAVNRAALREAARRDADDVVFISSDGYVLEGTTSTVVMRRDAILLTPGGAGGAQLGILDGTTQGDIFEWAALHGIATAVSPVTAGELRESDAVWLVSSGRQAVPVRSIDGAPHPVDAGMTAEINRHLATRAH